MGGMHSMVSFYYSIQCLVLLHAICICCLRGMQYFVRCEANFKPRDSSANIDHLRDLGCESILQWYKSSPMHHSGLLYDGLYKKTHMGMVSSSKPTHSPCNTRLHEMKSAQYP